MSTLYIFVLWWFVLMLVGVLNGALRTFTYQKYLPEIRAHQFSSFSGIFVIGFMVYLAHRNWPIQSGSQAIIIGTIWLVMTLVFELGFGRYIMKHPWKRLLHDYRIDKGRLWVLVLIWILLAPTFVYYYT